jgi:hypothetical protein
MGSHEAEERFAQPVAEKHVAGLLSLSGIDVRAKAIASNFLERARKAGWIARELDRGSVSEEFALAADGSLNEAAKEKANPTEKK